MNKISKEIFERAYQSYLYGKDIYTYKFSSNSPTMIKKYNDAIKELLEKELIILKNQSEDRAKISLTESGVKYGNDTFI